MELIIHSPSEDGFLKEISFNHEEIKQELTVRLEKYQGLVYSEEEIKIAKNDRATLNKFKEAIECKRKEVKKQCLAPYEVFEAKVKEILSLVDKPILEIDTQVKSFEEKCKTDKKQEIEAIYADSVAELKDVLPLKAIWNEKWLNSSYKISNIAGEIVKTIETAREDLKIIEDLKSEFELEIKNRYLETLLMSEALSTKTRLEQQKIKLQEVKVQQEKKEPIKEPVRVTLIPTSTVQENNQELEILEFKVWVNPEQKKALRAFLLEQKIKVGRI